jgi:hypothetical protein
MVTTEMVAVATTPPDETVRVEKPALTPVTVPLPSISATPESSERYVSNTSVTSAASRSSTWVFSERVLP